MPLNDTALLERWIARGDAEAFDEIVHRFADQVFGTARRILRNDADAEDVTQECFLLLVRSGGDVRTSLGGWLHRAATSRSLDRIRGEARRRAREQAYSESTAQVAEATWDDIQGHVDAAINQLPESTRDMIVAHFLGRKTHEEIAAELGMNRRAVSLRIQRGLESIRRDFAKRGITLTAAALGPLLTENVSAAAPLFLKASLGKLAIAAGTTGGAGVATFPSLIGSLLIMKTKIAIVAFVLCAIFAGIYVVYGLPKDSMRTPPPDSAAETPQPTSIEAAPSTTPVSASTPSEMAAISPSLEQLLAISRLRWESLDDTYAVIENPRDYASISGTISDDQGYAVSGASVLLIPSEAWGNLPNIQPRTRTAFSSEDGSYTIQGIKEAGPYWVNAAKPGFSTMKGGGLPGTPVQIEKGTAITDLDIRLESGPSIKGRVLTDAGLPVSGGVVQCLGASGQGFMAGYIHSAAMIETDGSFTMGFEEKYRGGFASLRVQSTAYGAASFPAVPIEEGDTVELRMSARSVIRGIVKYSDDKPVAGSSLAFIGVKRVFREGGSAEDTWDTTTSAAAFTAQCDSEGRYAVEVDSGLEYSAWIPVSTSISARELPRVGELMAGEVREYDVVLDADGITVRGRILNAQSRMPFAYHVMFSRVHAELEGEDAGSDVMMPDSIYTLTLPGKSGNYTFQATYGDESDTAGVKSGPFQLEPGDELELDLDLPEPQFFSVRAIDPDGRPVAGATVSVTMKAGSLKTMQTTDENGLLKEAIVLPPECQAQIWLEKAGYAMAWGTRYEDQSPGTVHPEDVIVMYAGAGFEGVLTDAEGDPVADLELLISLTSSSGQRWPLETRTDSEGHFTVVDRAPAEVVDIEIGIKPQAGPVEIRLGNDLVTLPGVEAREPTEPDLRIWRVGQVALEAGAITDLGNISLGSQ